MHVKLWMRACVALCANICALIECNNVLRTRLATIAVCNSATFANAKFDIYINTQITRL